MPFPPALGEILMRTEPDNRHQRRATAASSELPSRGRRARLFRARRSAIAPRALV
jgi:hypothetical protein